MAQSWTLSLRDELDLPSALAFTPDGASLLVGTERGVACEFERSELRATRDG